MSDGCWQWIGCITNKGYGQFYGNRGPHQTFLAHRLVLLVLGLPLAAETHHVCRNRACVNPDHLQPMTMIDHHRQHEHAYCIHGHSMDDAYIIRRKGIPTRQCRECKKERERQRRAGWSDERRAHDTEWRNERRRQQRAMERTALLGGNDDRLNESDESLGYAPLAPEEESD